MSSVYLGYIEDGDSIEEELDEQIAPWLVNKIGGLPIYPCSAKGLIELEQILRLILCKHCKTKCVLIVQMNSPIDDSSLDRVVQVFTCVKADCTKHSWFAVRCMFARDSESITLNDSMGPDLEELEITSDRKGRQILVAPKREFFKPLYLSVIEEPTGREDFAKNNLKYLKLASTFSDLDIKPAPIEEKYKKLKNYKPPKPPSQLSDLEDFEKFQLEKLYNNDKTMYRYYKRLGRFQAQVVRYDWAGEPLINSCKIKIHVPSCCCTSARKFEFQIMSALINYLETEKEFDRESMDFSSVIIHSCSDNCSDKVYNLEDTYFMPDPDARVYNKVKKRMLAMKLKDAKAEEAVHDIETPQVELNDRHGEREIEVASSQPTKVNRNPSEKAKRRKKKNKKK